MRIDKLKTHLFSINKNHNKRCIVAIFDINYLIMRNRFWHVTNILMRQLVNHLFRSKLLGQFFKISNNLTKLYSNSNQTKINSQKK